MTELAPVTKFAWSNARMGGLADPQVIGEALGRVADAAGGVLRIADAVAAAEAAPGSALHGLLQWDDSKAANMHRENQMRVVVRSIREVTIDVEKDDPVERRIYVNVIKDAERVYVPLRLVSGDEALTNAVMVQAIDGLRQWRNRFADLRGQLEGVFDVIDGACDDD